MELDKSSLLVLYPGYTSVLGPYTRNDGRQHVVLNNSDSPKGEKGKTKTISFPKAIVESNIGERLLPDETIDHDNGDFTDNSFHNLYIKNRKEHGEADAIRVHVHSVECSMCGSSFTPTVSQRNSKNKAGPFCSRKCAGTYGAGVQNGLEPIEKLNLKREYYKNEKI